MSARETKKPEYEPENEYIKIGSLENGSMLWHCVVDGAVVVDRKQHDDFLKVAVLATMKYGSLAGAYGPTH